MNRPEKYLPLLITLSAIGAMVLYGPIGQPAHYHDFADQRTVLGIANGLNVISNAGFAIAGLWGIAKLWPHRSHPALSKGWPGYLLFLCALTLTALGSSFYHLAPDNFHLVWDRLPIALACAGLLSAVYAETNNAKGYPWTIGLGLFAIISVFWWYLTEQNGHGDLRPYLLMQCLPLVLIPLWQAMHHSPYSDRQAFAAAIALYVVAKLGELYDYALLESSALGLSGHTIKHLLATAAAIVIIANLISRIKHHKDNAQEALP